MLILYWFCAAFYIAFNNFKGRLLLLFFLHKEIAVLTSGLGQRGAQQGGGARPHLRPLTAYRTFCLCGISFNKLLYLLLAVFNRILKSKSSSHFYHSVVLGLGLLEPRSIDWIGQSFFLMYSYRFGDKPFNLLNVDWAGKRTGDFLNKSKTMIMNLAVVWFCFYDVPFAVWAADKEQS